MNIASSIIDRFGGVRKLATLRGMAPSTVQSWKDSGIIPAKHQDDLLKLAKVEGVKLSPADFFASSSKEEAPGG